MAILRYKQHNRGLSCHFRKWRVKQLGKPSTYSWDYI